MDCSFFWSYGTYTGPENEFTCRIGYCSFKFILLSRFYGCSGAWRDYEPAKRGRTYFWIKTAEFPQFYGIFSFSTRFSSSSPCLLLVFKIGLPSLVPHFWQFKFSPYLKFHYSCRPLRVIWSLLEGGGERLFGLGANNPSQISGHISSHLIGRDLQKKGGGHFLIRIKGLAPCRNAKNCRESTMECFLDSWRAPQLDSEIWPSCLTVVFSNCSPLPKSPF